MSFQSKFFTLAVSTLALTVSGVASAFNADSIVENIEGANSTLLKEVKEGKKEALENYMNTLEDQKNSAMALSSPEGDDLATKVDEIMAKVLPFKSKVLDQVLDPVFRQFNWMDFSAILERGDENAPELQKLVYRGALVALSATASVFEVGVYSLTKMYQAMAAAGHWISDDVHKIENCYQGLIHSDHKALQWAHSWFHKE